MNNQHTIYFCQDGLEIELPQGAPLPLSWTGFIKD